MTESKVGAQETEIKLSMQVVGLEQLCHSQQHSNILNKYAIISKYNIVLDKAYYPEHYFLCT